MKLQIRKIKPLTFLLLILTSTIITLSFLPEVEAETKIISIDPSSGNVGTTVQLRANISTVNGTYEIWFDETFRTSGNATGNDVNVSLTVPPAPAGSHNVTIIDVATGENDTITFTVLTSYSFEPAVPESPAQLQEGENVTISINITGGKSNYTYPDIQVQTPSGNLTYEALKNITTNIVGDFYGDLTYPNDFSSGANTNFTGEYNILFNATVVNRFFIGLTNSSEYHRGDLVNIKAVDYPPNQNAVITIRFGNENVDSIILNVTDGIIDTNWAVPLNALVGNYTLSITPVPNSKQEANDTQIFEIPGFKTEIFTLNLANETVPNVFVRTYDESADTHYNTTSNEDGLANFIFERGNYTCEAFFKEVKVGEVNFTIPREVPVNFTCQLTSLNITVMDARNISIPQVSISLTYNYTTNLGEKENRTETEFGETNITGTLQFCSLLPNITYIINASRYNNQFNITTIPRLLVNETAIAWFNVTIICPTLTLQVNVTDADSQPISDAIVKVQEVMGGLYDEGSTTAEGIAIFGCTFGNYRVEVYASGAKINETVVDLFQNQNISICCKLYGLNVSIRVVDYFGQSIPDANVILQRDGLQYSPSTESNGMITFSNIIGGDLQITVYLPGQSQPCMVTTSSVDESTTIEIKIEKYVVIAGFLVETGQLTTAIIIVVATILILSIEIYRRKRLKPQKSVS
ncbi:MAG: hypothetical protein QMD13_01635 [Candidatus Bathyarchaeia archaeon]|nr:hypothetical protein [Candidatus Bathyarchaeia archaeon]